MEFIATELLDHRSMSINNTGIGQYGGVYLYLAMSCTALNKSLIKLACISRAITFRYNKSLNLLDNWSANTMQLE